MPEAVVSRSSADVVDGRILVRTTFADLLACRRIPGAAWDMKRKAWSFPATADQAELIKRFFRSLQATERFDALLQSTSANARDGATHGAPKPLAVASQESTAANGREPGTAMVASATVPEIALPSGLLTPPWRHQIAAFQFCLAKFAAGFYGLLLAMGMGTGKSLVACMLVLALAARRVLIACPLRVVPVWVTQFERHVRIPYVIVALDEEAGTVAQKQALAEEKLKLAEARGVPFICIINFDGIWREPFASWAEKKVPMWDVIIADEAHRIKAPGGKASLEFKRLRTRTKHRIALTGTPMPHGPMDLYAIFRFLDITIFGPSFSAYRQTYAVMGGYHNKQITGFQKLDQLERLMGKITFRVGKEVLDLPPETHVTYYCNLAVEARRVYRDLEEDFVAQVLDGTVTAANAMVKLLRLQQVAGGIVPTDDGVAHRIDWSKQKLLSDVLEDIGEDEPVVVFCRFHADLDAVHEACKQNEFSSLELSGRRDELKRWQDGEAQVLAVQISAGGVGVDLTRARYSMYYSLSFSLGEYDQALSRVHRPGQTRPVEHIHLVARNTVDSKIMRALEKRAEVVQAILAEIKN
ncbi:MAG: DEAD/DEAH box helicase [Bryobacterales bacterium]|nr:DEAD/DEAH box helicase [Bryobacterales bacterium]